jgi:hypothetical protein
MHADDAVVHLSSIAIVLPSHAHGMLAALAHARLVHDADGPPMRVVPSHNLLAAVAEFCFIPLDRFEKTL